MNAINPDDISKRLLNWYDENKRELPWRRDAPNPYHVLLSEMMLQQTTVATVKDYFNRFTAAWPSIDDLAKADDADILAQWAGLGYYARARNLIKTARKIHESHAFPNTSKELQKLPGIGPYTAAAIASIAFKEPILPRDGNINRILARLFGIADPIDRPSAALQLAADKFAHKTRAGDLAQAMMDLGSGICRPKNPKCDLCPIATSCAALHLNKTEILPQKAPKRAKHQWKANAFIAQKPDGSIGYVKRDAKERLGGLWALPCSDWAEEPSFDPPFDVKWNECGSVRHIFTHIDLSVNIFTAHIDMDLGDNSFSFFTQNELPPSSLPRLWGKVLEKYGIENNEASHE